MRLVDFLINLLNAHADTLKQLREILTEEGLIEILENALVNTQEIENPSLEPKPTNLIWFTRPNSPSSFSPSTAYTELENAVRTLNLPPILEFYLWSYPHYRAFIESPLDLNSQIQGNDSHAAIALVNEAMDQAKSWIRKLHLHPEVSKSAEIASQAAWTRFRTRVMKRVGLRPFETI